MTRARTFQLFTAKAVVLAPAHRRAYKITSNSWEYTGDGSRWLIAPGRTDGHGVRAVPSHRDGLAAQRARHPRHRRRARRGRVLRNNQGKRFMFDDIPDNYKPQTADTPEEGWRYVTGDKSARAARASDRDHVAAAFSARCAKAGSPHGGVFLDIAWIKEKIPNSKSTSSASCPACTTSSSSLPISTSPKFPWKSDPPRTT